MVMVPLQKGLPALPWGADSPGWGISAGFCDPDFRSFSFETSITGELPERGRPRGFIPAFSPDNSLRDLFPDRLPVVKDILPWFLFS
jgi:hypothetical protein